MKFTTPILVLSLTAGAAMAQSVMAPINKAKEAAAASSAKTAESTKALNDMQHPAQAKPASAPAATPFAPKTSAKPAPTTAAAQPKQSTPAAKPAANAVAGKAAAPAAKPAATPAKQAVAAAKPAAPATPAADAAKPEPEMEKKTIVSTGNRRDPFISIIRTDKTEGSPCLAGKKCLVIGEVVLRGIVKSSNSTIAVVENGQRKTYFLHESDPVFNGEVVKITPDSVVFREQITDRAGRPSTREITKHLNTRPIA